MRNGSDKIPLDLASASRNREVTNIWPSEWFVMDPWDGIDTALLTTEPGSWHCVVTWKRAADKLLIKYARM